MKQKLPNKTASQLAAVVFIWFLCRIATGGRVKKNLCGPMVKRYRDSLGLSQEALATKAQLSGWDIGRGVIAKIETGTRCVDNIELVKLVNLLSIDFQHLVCNN
jgi:DNA-binding XRE family transcriptional regulator